jgi:hypothetical protein
MTFQESVGSLSDESSSEHNQSYSDMSEELQTAFREEIEETNDPSKEKKVRFLLSVKLYLKCLVSNIQNCSKINEV